MFKSVLISSSVRSVYHFVIYLVVIILVAACEDPRNDQRDDNVFDPANSFVRFNYRNTLNGPAADTAVLGRDTLSILELPLAVSAPPQTQPVHIDFTLQTQGNLIEGANFELRDEDGQTLTARGLTLPPGDLDYTITLALTDTLAAPGGSAVLELVSVEPGLKLGFPGSGRGKVFTAKYE